MAVYLGFLVFFAGFREQNANSDEHGSMQLRPALLSSALYMLLCTVHVDFFVAFLLTNSYLCCVLVVWRLVIFIQ